MFNNKLSVIITTYNQSDYIKKAINSVLAQKQCPDFEVIIGDDASSDGTSNIITTYLEEYSDKIKYIRHGNNVGMLQNLKSCIDACTGEYIAICEGNDYWTDEYKLKKQCEILENNKNISLCFTNINLLKQKSNEILKHCDKIKQKLSNQFSIKDLIKFNNPIGNFSCCMYRRDAILNFIPNSYYEEKGAADWLFNMYILDKSEGYYLKDVCSIYRILETSIYNRQSAFEKNMKLIESSAHYNVLFEYKYAKYFLKFLENTIDALKINNEKSLLNIHFPISKQKEINVYVTRTKKVEKDNYAK